MIVVGFDGTDSGADAVTLGVRLARATGDRLLLAAIYPEESVPAEWARYTKIDATWFEDKAAARAEVDELKPR